MKYLIASLAVCLLVPSAVVAQDLPTEGVRYNDLNLATPHGQKSLERRIHWAIDDVCRHGDDPDPQIDVCRRNAERLAAPQIARAEAAHIARAQSAGQAGIGG